MKELEKCELCPRRCKVNRLNGEKGRCFATVNPKIAKVQLHYFEEPCISGSEGSGTIFFSGCNLSCKFCQNYKISQENKGNEVTIEELARMMIELQEQGANNINFVTGFAYVPQIIEAIKLSRENGLKIPIVYNTSGYESLETLKMLDGYIDIYLPDFKYYYNDLGEKLSNVNDYFEIVKVAIKEMCRQIKKAQYDEYGMMKKGIIIRHLILPNHIQNSKQVLKWIKKNIREDVIVSIMAQYFPTYKAKDTSDLNRKLTQQEYEEIEKYLYDLDIENGYIQELGEHEEEYVPKW